MATPVPFDDAQAWLNGPYYGLCYLSLAWQAYAKYPAAIPSGIAAMPAPKELMDGYQWQCVWGPVSDASPGDLSGPNLAYVVALNTITQPPKPVFVVVVLRGTDLSLALPADLAQLKDDLEVWKQVKWSDPSVACPIVGGEACVAQGTSIALGKLMAATAGFGSPTLFEFLYDLETNKCPGTPIVVTGHSLGGCLTTVVGPYLAEQFANKGVAVDILANPLAPPSAGNKAFGLNVYAASLSQKYASGSALWFNKNDPAGYFWNHEPNDLPCLPDVYTGTPEFDMRALPKLWQPGVPSAQIPTVWVCTIIDFLAAAFAEYAQPMPDAVPGIKTNVVRIETPVQVVIDGKPASYQNEFVFQHFPDTGYWDQIAGNNDIGWIPRPPYGETAVGAVVVTGAGQDLVVTVYGSGFPDATCNGQTIGAWPYTGNTDQFSLTNLTRSWNAGSTYWPDKVANGVTLHYSNWSRSQIVIRGFADNYGGPREKPGQWVVEPRDMLRVSLYLDKSTNIPVASATATAPA